MYLIRQRLLKCGSRWVWPHISHASSGVVPIIVDLAGLCPGPGSRLQAPGSGSPLSLMQFAIPSPGEMSANFASRITKLVECAYRAVTAIWSCNVKLTFHAQNERSVYVYVHCMPVCHFNAIIIDFHLNWRFSKIGLFLTGLFWLVLYSVMLLVQRGEYCV